MKMGKIYNGGRHYRLVKKEVRFNEKKEKEYWSLRVDIGNFTGIELYYKKNIPVWCVFGTTKVIVQRS
jgi:hypothetical protein